MNKKKRLQKAAPADGKGTPFSKGKAFSYEKGILFIWIAAFIIACITFLVYLPALKNGFVNWDDNLYVYENREIQAIDFRLFSWIPSVTIWHPMTMISLAVDYALWSMNPIGYHLTNNIIHAFNTFLVFVLISKLIEHGTTMPMERQVCNRPFIAAFVVAILFGLHPLHVESVAWISERKDVLSAFFYLLSLLS